MTYHQTAVLLAVMSAIGLALGIGWIYPPAGLIAFSLEGLTCAYLLAYFGRGTGEVPRRPS